nr:Ig-like domain-containing protein [bacterium]
MKINALACLVFCTLCHAVDPLRIVSVSPQGSVAFNTDVQTITVTFNQPMTALQAAPTERTEGPLIVRPAVKGIYRWMGTRTLAFTPDVPFKMASRYVLTVPAGVTSISGQSLAEAYTWTIETPLP